MYLIITYNMKNLRGKQPKTTLNPRVSPLVEIFAFFYDIGINMKFLTQGKITRIKSPLRRPPRDIFVDHPFPLFSRTNDTDNTTHNTHNHEISPGRPGYSWPSNEAWEGSHVLFDGKASAETQKWRHRHSMALYSRSADAARRASSATCRA